MRRSGQTHSAATRLKIGEGSKKTRAAEYRACPYDCGVNGNSGNLARHIIGTHEFVCEYPDCTDGPHKSRGYCLYHYGVFTSLRRHGLTFVAYAALWNAQGGRCVICQDPKKMVGDSSVTRADMLHVDHCHDSLAVRGLLCMRCNLLLGHARDRQEVLHAAIRYLSA